MIPVRDLHDIDQALNAVRRLAGREYLTNVFWTPEKIRHWVEHGKVFLSYNTKAAIILRKDRGFYHLYFGASGLTELGKALQESSGLEHGTLSADILGNAEDVTRLLPPFRATAFHEYAHLVRLAMMLKVPMPGDSPDAEVTWADVQDAPEIIYLQEMNFDPFAEQLPDLEEIAGASKDHRILVVKQQGQIAGFLYFEISGVTSVLRYWFVHSDFREQRIGSRLMRRYYAECKDVRRYLLWVLADNDNAIKRYVHFGFAPDGLTDRVMLRKGIHL